MSRVVVAAALQRVEAVLQRRPETGLHDDAPATACWQGGLRVESSHAGGTRLQTDMPTELGGSGDQVSPGWLLRAGAASCAATSIAMNAARHGIALDALEVSASSRSDARGMFGMSGADGVAVPARALGVELLVRIAAAGVASARLHQLVDESCRHSPVPDALRNAVPLSLKVEVDGVAMFSPRATNAD